MSLLFNVLNFIQLCIDWLFDYIFGLYYNSKNKVPNISNPLLLESATSLAKRIRNQEITSENLVKLFITRIKEVNPIINAIVDCRFDVALVEAKQIDADIKNGVANFKDKPFLGVPFTSKESTRAKGMRNTLGLICRKDVVAEEDADVVAAFKKAGAILIGVSNIPQISMWQESSNPVYGTTKNPYDTTRHVGGSTGGGAAIIAACGCPFGLGTDIGGSIRIPSFMCGIVGHKPSSNLISTKGISYRDGNEGPTMLTCGILTRYTEDIIPSLKVLVGDKINVLKLDEEVNVRNVNIFYVSDIKFPFTSSLRKEMKQAISRVLKYFKNNCTVSPQNLNLPDIAYSSKIWRYWMKQEKGVNFFADVTNRKSTLHPAWEIIKFLTGYSELNAHSMMVMGILLLPQPNEQWALRTTIELKQKLLAKLGNNGVLIFPSASCSARYHNMSLVHPVDFRYYCIWNVLKMPVTQVPLGLDKDGLPIGIQIVAAPNHDHLCIAVARELERVFGGYVPPFQNKNC